MMIQALSVLLVIISSILCSGTQQGVSSTQSGQTLQIQPNVRKYNKHTATEKPCTTGSTTGTRKDKPDGSQDVAQDYVPIGGPAGGAGYPYPYPYPYPAYPAYPAYPYPPVGPAPGGVVLVPGGGNPQAYRPPPQPYPYEPQYPVEAAPSYYPAPSPYYPAAGPSPLPPPPPPQYYAPGYPAASQSLYDQSVVVDAYRPPQPYPQPATVEQQQQQQQQFFRQPAASVPPYYYNNNYAAPSPHFRAHAAYNRPAIATQSFLLQQRDATATATPATNTASSAAAANGNGNANNNAEPQYEQQQSGPFDSNQFHF